jgi:hypothetical protein
VDLYRQVVKPAWGHRAAGWRVDQLQRHLSLAGSASIAIRVPSPLHLTDDLEPDGPVERQGCLQVAVAKRRNKTFMVRRTIRRRETHRTNAGTLTRRITSGYLKAWLTRRGACQALNRLVDGYALPRTFTGTGACGGVTHWTNREQC